ncbi:ABC transporter permease [Kribbella sp. NPDC048915]|uniref:ABC transporter permease n=1 Tax=Kribbella sp. NPDC048915 TaxID=3155148 RepID=UPI0033C9351B
MRFLSDLWRILRHDKGALIGGAIVLIYCLAAVFGPIFVEVGNEQDASQAYLAPSWEHPLGTDSLGQGVLSQIIVGTRPIMIVGVLSAVITVFIGVAIGLLTGYVGGVADTVIMRITDIFLTIPGLPLIIVLASVINTTNPVVLAFILSITAWAGLARAIRSQAMSLRSREFVEAAKLQGVSLGNMVGRQLLPNVGPYVAIHFLLAITGAIYASVGLFLLGIAPISGNNWGIMINLAMAQGALYTTDSAFYLFSPMAAIVILQVAFVFFSRALDSVFNPRLRVQ